MLIAFKRSWTPRISSFRGVFTLMKGSIIGILPEEFLPSTSPHRMNNFADGGDFGCPPPRGGGGVGVVCGIG